MQLSECSRSEVCTYLQYEAKYIYGGIYVQPNVWKNLTVRKVYDYS